MSNRGWETIEFIAYLIFLAVFLGIIVVSFTAIIVTWAIKCIIEWIDDLRSTLKYW